MKKTDFLLRMSLWGAVAIAVLGVILRTVCVLFFFDGDIGYFNSSAVSFVTQGLSVLSVVFCGVVCIIIPKGVLPTSDCRGTSRLSLSLALPSLLLGAFAVAQLISPLVPSGSSLSRISLFATILALGGCVCGLSALLTHRADVKGKCTAGLGFLTAAWAILCLADLYFDLLTPMNSPVKTIMEFAFLSVALLAITELRFLYDKAHPRMAAAVYGIASYFTLTAGVSTLASIAVSPFKLSNVIYAVALTGMGIYAVTRLFGYLLPQTQVPSGHEPSQEDAL